MARTNMTNKYVTPETNLPENLDGEITFQVTDTETREIFRTRARVTQDETKLTDPEPLTVVRGPHEDTEEQWYIDIIETDPDTEAVNEDILRRSIQDVRDDTNVINTRSEDVKVLLMYLVYMGQYESLSDASRSILIDVFSENHSDLVEAYIELRAEFERNDLAASLQQAQDHEHR